MSTILTLQPDASAGIDTYVAENVPDGNYGGLASLAVGAFMGIRTFSLVRFDLSSIPQGSTINSAILYLYGSGNGNNTHFYINRILPANSAWTEGGATWNYAVASTTRWAGDADNNGGTDAGCSVAGTDYASTLLGTMAYKRTLGTENFSALSVVEFALMLAANHGILIRDQGGGFGSKQPLSSDYLTVPAYRPKLLVNYNAPVVIVPDVFTPVGVTAPQFVASEQNYPFTC